MNNKKKKLLYIKIKNSWRRPGKELEPFTITTSFQNGLPINPLYATNEIRMDFKKRNEIVKYGVMKVRGF